MTPSLGVSRYAAYAAESSINMNNQLDILFDADEVKKSFVVRLIRSVVTIEELIKYEQH